MCGVWGLVLSRHCTMWGLVPSNILTHFELPVWVSSIQTSFEVNFSPVSDIWSVFIVLRHKMFSVWIRYFGINDDHMDCGSQFEILVLKKWFYKFMVLNKGFYIALLHPRPKLTYLLYWFQINCWKFCIGGPWFNFSFGLKFR